MPEEHPNSNGVAPNQQKTAPKKGEGSSKNLDIKKSEVVIHTMPKEFLGIKVKKVKTKKPEVKLEALKKEAKAKPTDPIVVPASKPQKGPNRLMLIIIFALILLLSVSVIAYYYGIKPQPGTIQIPDTDTPDLIPSPVCGNGSLEDGETCDDGNLEDGDGCSARCLVEETPESVCGNEIMETGETCDDGNLENGDGCSALCVIEDEPEPLDNDLVQKVGNTYDAQGNKVTEAVLSMEREQGVNYGLITISEYVIEEQSEYFPTVAGSPYEVKLRGEALNATAILSITYVEEILGQLDLIPADLRIAYLSFDKLQGNFYRNQAGQLLYLAPTEPGEEIGEIVSVLDIILGEEQSEVPVFIEDMVIWEILKAAEVDDDDLNSITSVMQNGTREGVYAIVPFDINETLELDLPPEVRVITGEVVRSVDSDFDLLTDKEELLYGTNPMLRDTDQDGYSDGDEVLKLFSPARGGGVSIEDDAQFARWNNLDYNYSVIIPQINVPRILDSTRDVILKASDLEAILISVQDNPVGLDLEDWLKSISPDIDVNDFVKFTTVSSGFSALGTEDGTTYYVLMTGNPYVYVFSYTASGQYNYLTTFRAIVESLKYIKDNSDIIL